MRLESTRRMSSACRWEASPVSTSRCAIPGGCCRWWLRAPATAPKRSTRIISKAFPSKNFEERGAKDFAPIYAEGASRVQFQEKDPRGWQLFADRLGQHDSKGAANTMRGVQMRRPSLYDLEAEFRALETPVLVMVGDEDDHCLQPGLFLKRTIKRAALAVFPKSGHTLNLEEPELFNRMVSDFIAQVEAGRWTPRDPRANPAQVMRTD
jgi:pimeloyl-ACP methyl ester carboxylesterase